MYMRGDKVKFLYYITESKVIDEVLKNPNFKKWFGRSKVVDSSGRPLICYHGTASIFTSFDANKIGVIKYSDWGKGLYFTPAKWQADIYREDALKALDSKAGQLYKEYEEKAKEFGTTPMDSAIDLGYGSKKYRELVVYADRWLKRLKEIEKSGKGNIMEVFLSIQKPLEYVGTDMTDPFLSDRAQSKKHDGIIVRRENGSIDEIVVFKPTQIKSIYNKGTFNPHNSDTME